MSEQERKEQEQHNEERPLTHNEAMGIRTLDDLLEFIWAVVRPERAETTRNAEDE